MSIAVGIVAGVLSALAAYAGLGGPLPASNHSVAQVQSYAEDTREIVLLDKLILRQGELDDAIDDLAKDPDNEALKQLIKNLRRQILLIERQLADLEKKDA